MDRARFEYLLAAYGADFQRLPERERLGGEVFAREREHELEALLSAARALDGALGAAKEAPAACAELTARILAAAPRAARPPVPRASFAVAGWALAACALVGVVVGYSAGTLAPPTDEDSYFTAAFEAPPAADPGDQG
jgi:hypothetical protein